MLDHTIEEVHGRISEFARRFGHRWIIAVSGGSDSVGLLRLAHEVAPELGLVLSVAHLNHGSRGDASRADAQFVESLASQLELPFSLGHWRAERSGHFESDARLARYAWLTDLARNQGASVIAAGHTRDDQAETILHRILRGTGIRGLVGIPEARDLSTDPPITLVRPLLETGRDEIRDYLVKIRQSFREDVTNTDTTRTRARLRHDLIPRIESEYNPRFVEAITRLGKLAASANNLIEDHLQQVERSTVLEISPSRIVLHRPRLLELDRYVAIEFMRHVWTEAGWPEREMSTARWNRLHAFAGRPDRRARFSLGSGIEALIDRNLLILRESALPSLRTPS